MDTSLTFKEYLANTRRQLEEALTKIPVNIVEYRVLNYCRIMIGENIETKQSIALKPKQTVHVKWLYEDVNNPTPISIQFKGVDKVETEVEYEVYWSGEQLADWLDRNTRKK